MTQAEASVFDFDLHGYLRLRLENATQHEADVVQRQVGPIGAPVTGTPDILIRFVDRLPEAKNLRYIGLNDAAFSDTEGFYVLKGKNKAHVKVMIPFDQIGNQMEICAERGINNIPLLMPIINLVLLTKGILPFHASAFIYRGQGVLVTGWAKGGKTETLLAFMAQGAHYVGDEWVYLCPDGTGMFGIPEPIRVWKWHLESLPVYQERLKRKDKIRLGSLSALNRSLQWVAGTSKNGNSAAGLAQRISPIVQRQMFVHFQPHKLFGTHHCQPSSRIDKIFFAASHNDESVLVEPIDPEEVARRMIFSLREEQMGLISYYMKYRFAFPDRPNHWMDNLERIQLKLLVKALRGKEAYALYHPYPVQIPRLYEAVQPYLP